MTLGDFTIVVAAYDRVHSLKRCLHSLSKAAYSAHTDLIISMDDSDNHTDVYECAKAFEWSFGSKHLIRHTSRLGLRGHILQCGQLTKHVGAIAMIEDDIYVSPDFSSYAAQALRFYREDSRIAGISLYSPRFNETARLPFEPLKRQHDVYFMQAPSSWGQLWTPEQWSRFEQWYNYNMQSAVYVSGMNPAIPPNVMRWRETSWKKYYFMYMVRHNTYFVYPYESYSTNFGEVGVHFKKRNHRFQVQLSYSGAKSLNLCALDDASVIYDAFHENTGLAEHFDGDIRRQLTIDLYATKEPSTSPRFALTTRKLNCKIVEAYDLTMKPMENNVLQRIKGMGIFLYDLSKARPFPDDKTYLALNAFFEG